jgi:hypothetical protein
MSAILAETLEWRVASAQCGNATSHWGSTFLKSTN